MQVVIENQENFPEASKSIQQHFYMDDCLCGSDNIENARILKNQIIVILNSAKFPLRKFYSNDERVIMDSNRGALEQFNISDDRSCKTLGLYWIPQSGIFSFSINFDISYINSVTQLHKLRHSENSVSNS